MFFKNCLNPCCNGIYLIITQLFRKPITSSLNPCCNGIYLIMPHVGEADEKASVLILVVMEDT